MFCFGTAGMTPQEIESLVPFVHEVALVRCARSDHRDDVEQESLLRLLRYRPQVSGDYRAYCSMVVLRVVQRFYADMPTRVRIELPENKRRHSRKHIVEYPLDAAFRRAAREVDFNAPVMVYQLLRQVNHHDREVIAARLRRDMEPAGKTETSAFCRALKNLRRVAT